MFFVKCRLKYTAKILSNKDVTHPCFQMLKFCYGLFCFVLWLNDERRLALFPAGTFARDPHHRESPTHRM